MPIPLKRHKALVQYSKEHHFGLLLGWKIRQGANKNVSPERITNYIVAACKGEIMPHFDNEEEHLFVLLEQSDPLRLQVEEEHAVIRKKLKEIEAGTTIEELIAFSKLMDAHIRFEEKVLFPHIEEQQSFKVFAAAMKAHESLPLANFDAGWEEQFWR